VAPFLRHNRIPVLFLFSAGLGFLCALAGCQSLPRSGFDPSGQRLFESNPLANCPLFNRGTDSPTTISTTPIADPTQQPDGASPGGASIYTPPPTALPGDLGASRSNPAVPQYGSTATALPPGAHAVTTALIHNPDAGPSPVFANTGGYALPTVPVTGPALIMTPREQIAPLGSEVVLIASYLGNGDRLITNEKIEWSLEGAGTIEKFDAGSCCDILFLDHVKAKKIMDRYAVTKTSSVYQTIDRGTSDTTDDIHLLRGQTWVSVNSMKEGTTHVTAFGPNMADWSKRTDVGIVHWVDAQWILPRLAIAPVGESRVLTTTVLRATNGQPRRGWIVRYEILNGPAAGLGASGAQIEEVETDLSGQATTILTPSDQRAGTNTIGIQIIRPAGVDGDRRITVGSEMVRQTWSGNPNILLNIRGLSEGRLGQDLPYEITAENRSSSAVQGVIALPIPPLASYIRSEPAGILQGSTVLWNVNLLPNNTTRINVVLRQGTAGSLWLRPEFRRTSSPVTPSAPVLSQSVPAPSPVGGGAAVFPGTVPTPTPAAQPSAPAPTPSPATVSQKPSLSVQIERDPTHSLVPNPSFRFYVRVTNTGTTDARDVIVFVPLPEALRGQNLSADYSTDWNLLAVENRKISTEGKPAGWVIGIDKPGNRAVLRMPVFSAGSTAYFLLEYPTIGPGGYNITCTVYADGQVVTQESRQMMP